MNSRNRRRKRRKAKGGLILFLSMLLCTVCIVLAMKIRQKEEGIPAAEECREWNLILVNRDHPLPDTWQPQLLKLSNGQYVDERIYPELQAMFDEARSHGIQLYVRSGWRSHEKQQELYDKRYAQYRAEGMSEEEAKRETELWVMPPGTSEHESGLCVDINSKGKYLNDDTASWLRDHAAEYGFVQRYEDDKTDVTGVSGEPWHYRYVGAEAARQMKEAHLSLEEYHSYGCRY